MACGCDSGSCGIMTGGGGTRTRNRQDRPEQVAGRRARPEKSGGRMLRDKRRIRTGNPSLIPGGVKATRRIRRYAVGQIYMCPALPVRHSSPSAPSVNPGTAVWLLTRTRNLAIAASVPPSRDCTASEATRYEIHQNRARTTCRIYGQSPAGDHAALPNQ